MNKKKIQPSENYGWLLCTPKIVCTVKPKNTKVTFILTSLIPGETWFEKSTSFDHNSTLRNAYLNGRNTSFYPGNPLKAVNHPI